MNTSRCTASSTSAGSRRLAPEELQAFFALDLSDPVERARVVGASGAPHVTDGAGRGQRVVALAALRKETRSGAVGRTDAGANDEEAVVAVRNHCVVAAAALRTKTMSRAVGRADAGQTSRRLLLPVTVSTSLPPRPCGRKRGRERWGGRTRGTPRPSPHRPGAPKKKRAGGGTHGLAEYCGSPAITANNRTNKMSEDRCECVFSCVWTRKRAFVCQ